MDIDRPYFVPRETIFEARPHRSAGVRFTGLWLVGSLEGLRRPTVAVVGSRAPSEGGIARAGDLAAALGAAGVCVISGLALGIDGASHAGALAGGGPTLGVLGGGHRQFFPRRNRPLAERIVAAGGAVLSPYAPDDAARPGQFLQRNGVVAALADAVVVVEAAARSGALNTASWAAALGSEVLAFPGDVDRPKAAGCNALIRDGATLVRGVADVLEALGLARTPAAVDDVDVIEAVYPGPLESAVYAALQGGPRDLDALVANAGAAPGAIMAALVELQLAGFVERRDANVFARTAPTRKSNGAATRLPEASRP